MTDRPALNDPGFVADQYRSTARLDVRRSVWQPLPPGESAQDVAIAALAEVGPVALLEVGCGTGELAERCARELGCRVLALDQSKAMVDATAARGVEAVVGDVQALPFPDGSFDCALAAWMLYHVPDLERGLAELRRVVRPGGRLVAITNGDGGMAELLGPAGLVRPPGAFSRENGAGLLAGHFDGVVQIDLRSTALFADAEIARAYLESTGYRPPPDLGERLDWPLEVTGAPTVFIADVVV